VLFSQVFTSAYCQGFLLEKAQRIEISFYQVFHLKMSKTEVLLEFNERQSNCCCSHLKNVFVDGKATEASSSFADAR